VLLRSIRKVLTPLIRLLQQWHVRHARHRNICGFDAYASPVSADPEASLDRLTAALEYLRARHPYAFARVRRRIKCFLVRPSTWSAYWPTTQTAVLGQPLLETGLPAYAIATTIVSLATRASFPPLGWTSRRGLRERVERRCVQEELAIAKSEPGSELLVDWLTERARRPAMTNVESIRRRLADARHTWRIVQAHDDRRE
jgi:hypothetical protein